MDKWWPNWAIQVREANLLRGILTSSRSAFASNARFTFAFRPLGSDNWEGAKVMFNWAMELGCEFSRDRRKIVKKQVLNFLELHGWKGDDNSQIIWIIGPGLGLLILLIEWSKRIGCRIHHDYSHYFRRNNNCKDLWMERRTIQVWPWWDETLACNLTSGQNKVRGSTWRDSYGLYLHEQESVTHVLVLRTEPGRLTANIVVCYSIIIIHLGLT